MAKCRGGSAGFRPEAEAGRTIVRDAWLPFGIHFLRTARQAKFFKPADMAALTDA